MTKQNNLFLATLDALHKSGAFEYIILRKTRGRFVCHILKIYIYLIESPPAVKRD